ncbi:MAG: c-type cytochrome biogenesis protein CcsB [Desulfobacterales bacterium]|nr:c-type cytochrome biogenesis protein CcsB [Desulfobacterales bacterium]
MNSSIILSVITFVYGLAAFLYVAAWVFKKEKFGKIATWVVYISVVGNTAGIALRWVETYQQGFGHAPLSNLYESLVFFALVIGVLYLFIEKKYKLPVIGVVAMPLAFLSIAYASMGQSSNIQPLMPALKSNWLIAHVVACFIGYSAFAIAFGISCLYLMKRVNPDRKGFLFTSTPTLSILDDLTHQMVKFGFLFLTVGIITGAAWANSAWGRYWGWDPKETWSLITWFVYAAMLHARLVRGWQGKRIAYMSIIGFAAVLFTYFGVNLLPGLHSYQ